MMRPPTARKPLKARQAASRGASLATAKALQESQTTKDVRALIDRVRAAHGVKAPPAEKRGTRPAGRAGPRQEPPSAAAAAQAPATAAARAERRGPRRARKGNRGRARGSRKADGSSQRQRAAAHFIKTRARAARRGGGGSRGGGRSSIRAR